jgi:O-antigen/teichoic acid export membrane protein
MADKAASGLTSVMQSMAGRILFVLINAATGIVTARALHPSGRGELAALGVWPNFLGSAMTFGLPSALVFWSRSEPDHNSNFLWASLPITVLMGSVAVLFGVIGIPFWLSQYSPHIIHVAQLLMLNAFIVLLTLNARAACEAGNDFFASSLALCMMPFFALVALVTVYLNHSLTPVTAVLCYVGAGLPSCIFLVFRVRHSFTQRPTHVLLAARKLLSYGSRSYGVDICGTLSLYADQAVVVHLLDPGAMGIYVVALSLSRTLNVIHQAVAAVLFPKAVSLQQADLIAMTGRATRISTLCTSTCGALVALLGPGLLSLLYGREYRDATMILNILIAEVILTGATLVLTRAYMALNRPGLVTVLQSSGLLLSLPLLAVFVPRWGVLGASFALLTAAVVRLAVALASFRFVLGQPAPGLLPRIDELQIMARRLRNAGSDALRRRAAEVAGV